MPRTIAYRAGGFTNCGIGYTKFSQEDFGEIEVIGNAIDNPELVEV